VLFITGYHASGKTRLANLLSEKFNVLHIETSSIVRSFKEQDDPEAPMGAWARQKEANFGSTFFDELIVETVRERYIGMLEHGNVPQDIVITGNRSLSGIQYAAEHLADLHEKSSVILAVKAGGESLYRRYRERNRRAGDAEMSFDDFSLLMKEEQDVGIEEIFMHSDYTIPNEGTEREFLDSAEIFFTKELGLRNYMKEGEDIVIHREGNKNTGY
jgi:dephospho-CoA kinase